MGEKENTMNPADFNLELILQEGKMHICTKQVEQHQTKDTEEQLRSICNINERKMILIQTSLFP